MFRALSSQTRFDMLKMLIKDEMHISALAKKLGISVPVASKHVKILEKADLISRKVYGRSHVLKAKIEKIYDLLNVFSDITTVELPKGNSALEALKLTSAISTKKINDKELLVSIDGKEGYYLYEVNDRTATVSLDHYKLMNNSELKLKKLIPITEKIVKIKMR